MAPSKQTSTKSQAPAEPAAPSESLYPAIEGFIENASAEEVKGLYGDVREALGALKGPRAEAAKKAGKGISRAEELLSFLLQVREKIQAERKGK